MGAVAAAAVGAQVTSSPSAAAAAGGPSQLSTHDPALDSLIDRWLSHKHASTSAPEQNGSSGGSGSSGSSTRGQQRQQQQELAAQQDWEALLGPVTVTMASLATLEVREACSTWLAAVASRVSAVYSSVSLAGCISSWA